MIERMRNLITNGMIEELLWKKINAIGRRRRKIEEIKILSVEYETHQ
ncbi:MAG: hypothetical protein HFH87_01565 [Lachnospiraceae bacterium]|nr:hypothetical protein [Lachnospiraceae bacterium]